MKEYKREVTLDERYKRKVTRNNSFLFSLKNSDHPFCDHASRLRVLFRRYARHERRGTVIIYEGHYGGVFSRQFSRAL